MTNGSRTSRKNEKSADSLATITKANRTGSQPNANRNALALLSNNTVPSTSSVVNAAPSTLSAGATQQSSALKQAATAAAANSKATKELLEAIQNKVSSISERHDELFARFDRLDSAQGENKIALENIMQLLTRLNVSRPQANAPRSRNFSDETIEKAAEYDLDLTKPLSWEGPLGKVKIMELPFNNLNGNLFGTKAMSKLFTQMEMAEGSIESTEDAQFGPLDQERIDLIKRCYIKKLNGDVDKFIEMWPNIRTALKQKCRDQRRSLRGNASRSSGDGQHALGTSGDASSDSSDEQRLEEE